MPSVKMTDNINVVLEELSKATARALEMIGGRAETHAKEHCPVDTGLLRNSITHGVNGGKTSISSYSDSKGENGGEYSGNLDTYGAEPGTVVVIGSNVKYAPYVELGTRGRPPKPPAPFLRPALENYLQEYKDIIESELGR